MNRYNDEGASSSSTSQSSQKTETDDDRMIAIVLSEEYANLDNAVAKRLSSLSSIPVTNPINSLSLSIRHYPKIYMWVLWCLWCLQHVPRINTCIPNYNDASFDHERLFHRY
jgi:hypothetical protein